MGFKLLCKSLLFKPFLLKPRRGHSVYVAEVRGHGLSWVLLQGFAFLVGEFKLFEVDFL